MTDVLIYAKSLLVAAGIGMLIGAERERRKGVGPTRRAAGLRTFTITALLGAVSMMAGGVPVLITALVGLIALTTVSYLKSSPDDPGLTTEIALVTTLVLGGLAIPEPQTAAACGVIVAVLLAARGPLHRFVQERLSEGEMRSALILASASLIVWPLLPDKHLGPFDALNPKSIWSVAVMVMAIGAAGHLAVRALGARYGLPLAGLASGFVSSSATIAAMGTKAKASPALLGPATAGALLSTVATVMQMAILIAAVSAGVLGALWLPLALGGAAAVAYGAAFSIGATSPVEADAVVERGEAFSPWGAILFAALVAGILLLAAATRHWLGARGVGLAAALAGFADTHAAAISVASLVAAGKVAPEAAAVPILLGFTSNSITKIMLAVSSGSFEFAVRVVPGILCVLAAVWIGWLIR